MSEQSGSGSVELSRGGTVCLRTVAAQPLGGSVADGPPWPCAPRKGCDEAFLDQLDAFSPRRIVYVSCAPDTQARDVKYLCAKGWKVVSVRPFDLFPQTRHVECIAALERA